MFNMDQFKFNDQLVFEELQRRGVTLSLVGNTNIVSATYQGHHEFILDRLTSLTPVTYYYLWKDKYFSREVMRELGIPVLPGEAFHPEEKDLALTFAEQIGFPVVVKPTDAGNGDFIFCKLPDAKALLKAIDEFSIYFAVRNMLIEKYFEGDDYSFLVVNSKIVSVVHRSPPAVIGDGMSTLRECINRENERRMNPRNTCLCRLFIDDNEGRRVLQEQGVTEHSVIPAGQRIILRHQTNVCWGGECENVTEQVHPSFNAWIEQIQGIFPLAKFYSVDFLVKDITQPATETNAVFCEFNNLPGISLHEMPSKGTPKRVSHYFADLLFPETANAN